VSVGGFRFGLFTIPPEQEADYPEDMEGAMAEMEAKLPGAMAHMELDDPGMHTTDTTDYEIVLSGQVVLELDDGAEVTLSPGDTVVQNGTRHSWRNRGTEPAVLGVVLVGAHRS
jgi:mannose-6-phosphate isomerase-like protein (cupin superfamily)